MAEHSNCPTCSCKTAPPQPEGDVLVTDVNGDIWTPERPSLPGTIWSCCTRTCNDATWQELWAWNDEAGHQLLVYRNERESTRD